MAQNKSPIPSSDVERAAAALIEIHGDRASEEAAAYLLTQIVMDDYVGMIEGQDVLDAVMRAQREMISHVNANR